MDFGDEVLQGLETAIEAAPNNFSLRKHYAEMLFQRGRHDAALNAFREALKLRPNEDSIRVQLARLYWSMEKRSAALVILEDLLSALEPLPEAYQLMAEVKLSQNDLSGAQEAYQKALQGDPALRDENLDRQLFMQVSQQLNAPELREFQPSNEGVDLDLESQLEAVALPLSEGEILDLEDVHERPLITFDDVGGMQQVKEEIEIKLIQALKNPELFRAYGKSTGGGVLMYGPPGCGKTHLARATAGEVEAPFLCVGINDILEMWLGQSERNLHAVFEQARQQRPCVLFIDEVDALGASRADMRQTAGRQLINQFLQELDGIQHSNEGVLILAATNVPWQLDTAFRRPGRFDRIIFVPPPDLEARAAILELYLSTRPVEKVDVMSLAKKTVGFSGADLKSLVEMAVDARLRDALKSGQALPIRQKDLTRALKQLKPTTQEWFTTARNYAVYANQSGFYDEILHYLNLQ